MPAASTTWTKPIRAPEVLARDAPRRCARAPGPAGAQRARCLRPRDDRRAAARRRGPAGLADAAGAALAAGATSTPRPTPCRRDVDVAAGRRRRRVPRAPAVGARRGRQLVCTLQGRTVDDDWLVVLREVSDAATVEATMLAFGLTLRESEVLYWVAKGKTNRDIGDILGSSPATVKKHLERVYEKLGVETRTAAAAMAMQRVAELRRRNHGAGSGTGQPLHGTGCRRSVARAPSGGSRRTRSAAASRLAISRSARGTGAASPSSGAR